MRLCWYDPATGAEVIQDTTGSASPFSVPDSLGEDVALFIEYTGDGPPPDPPPDPPPPGG